jgi:sRNA-binding regulator protein Hfq
MKNKKDEDGFVTVSALQHAPEPVTTVDLNKSGFQESRQDMHPSGFHRSQFTYFMKYDHKLVHIVLVNGAELDGIVHTRLNDNYDFELETKSNRIFVPKHSVLYCYEVAV